jgi:hypothetical protein
VRPTNITQGGILGKVSRDRLPRDLIVSQCPRGHTVFSSSELDRIFSVPRAASLFLRYFGNDKVVRRDSVDTGLPRQKQKRVWSVLGREIPTL